MQVSLFVIAHHHLHIVNFYVHKNISLFIIHIKMIERGIKTT